MQSVIPALRVSAYASSKTFYEQLGFVELWTHQFEPGFPVFAAVARDGMQIFLTEHTGGCAFGAKVRRRAPPASWRHCAAPFVPHRRFTQPGRNYTFSLSYDFK